MRVQYLFPSNPPSVLESQSVLALCLVGTARHRACVRVSHRVRGTQSVAAKPSALRLAHPYLILCHTGIEGSNSCLCKLTLYACFPFLTKGPEIMIVRGIGVKR